LGKLFFKAGFRPFYLKLKIPILAKGRGTIGQGGYSTFSVFNSGIGIGWFGGPPIGERGVQKGRDYLNQVAGLDLGPKFPKGKIKGRLQLIYAGAQRTLG